MSRVLFSPVVMGIVVTLAVLYLMTRGRKVMLSSCIALAVPAFVIGLALYTIGYMPEGGSFGDMLTAMLRGLFSTGRMFLINDDYSFLLDDAAKDWLTGRMDFQVVFWLCHVLALIVSVSAIMGLFGHRLINAMRLRFRFYKSCYIIYGSGENAHTLGENIATHDGATTKSDPSRLVVYLVPELPEELNDTLSSFGAIALECDQSTMHRQLRKAGLGAASWRIPACRVILMAQSDAVAMTALHETLVCADQLGLGANRLAVYTVSESEWVKQYAQRLTNERLPSGERRWPYTLHTAGEAELAARHLVMTQPPCLGLPFQNGVAQRDLSVLILGLGKTGSQALRRLIMNGQFVGSNMKALVVDREADRLKGSFARAYPGLVPPPGKEDSAKEEENPGENPVHCCQITYRALDVRSDAFFDLLDEHGADVNYVVLALNDDEQNLETGQALIAHYRRDGRGMPLFALAIADGEGAGDEEDGIVFFSRRGDIYSESTLIREEIDSMAMAVNQVYELNNNPDAKDRTARQLWHELDSFGQESNRAAADFIPSMLHLVGLSEEEAAQRGSLTDDSVMAVTLAKTEHLRWNAFHYSMGYTPMSIETMEARFAQLAKEGKNPGGCRKDAQSWQHACLVSWEELIAVSDAYNVLFAGVGLASERQFQKEDEAVVTGIPAFIQQKYRTEKRRGHGGN